MKNKDEKVLSVWKQLTGRRPVFTADYIPGVPSVLKHGKKDISSDMEHIKSYLDPILSRAYSFAYECDYLASYSSSDARSKGWAAIPDITAMSADEIKEWIDTFRPVLEKYRALYSGQGIGIFCIGLLFLCHGCDSSPRWFHKIEGWEECDASGKPLGDICRRLTTACLSHPELYRIIDKTFQVIGDIYPKDVLLGIHIDNEPNLSLGRDLSEYGGNPFTVAEFIDYLRKRYDSVKNFNAIAGTGYDSFGEIHISDENWLVKANASMFRATLVTGKYLKNAAASARKHFPEAVLATRLQTGYFLKEQDGGREINGMELTYLKESEYDVLAWCNQWDSRINDGIGQLAVTGGLLRGSGKMLGLSETFMQRYGFMHYSAYNPEEVLHLIYRGLYYNVGMHNLHTWDRLGEYVHDEPFGVSYLGRPDTLKTVALARMELDRIKPFETFGKQITAPIAVILSRNARNFPHGKGFFYGNMLYHMCRYFEKPEFSDFEIVEECSSDLNTILEGCRGAVVFDACLSEHTRKTLSAFSENGGKLLVFAAGSVVGPVYEPLTLPSSFPVESFHADLSDEGNEIARGLSSCRKINPHPVLKGIRTADFIHSFNLKPVTGSIALMKGEKEAATVVSRGNIVYFSGMPCPVNEVSVSFTEHHQIYEIPANAKKTDDLEKVLINFAEWCGIKLSGVITGRFEKAVVLQNTDKRKSKSWTGSAELPGDAPGAVSELRKDSPWLAYRRSGGRTVLEGIKLESGGIKVFRREDAKEGMHVENIPDTIGFEEWWAGTLHPVIGRFTASKKTRVNALVAGEGSERPGLIWFAAECGGKKIASGSGNAIIFDVSPGKKYYLTVSFADHPHIDDCPLCIRHMFE